MKFYICTLFLLILLVITACDCRYEISGVVLDEQTKKPVSNVAIGKTDTADLDNSFNRKSFTGKHGEFEINGIAGTCNEVTMYFTNKDYFTKKITFDNNAFDTVYLKRKSNLFFDPHMEYRIADFAPKSDSPSSMEDTTICKEWGLNEKQIRTVLVEAREISGPDWHHLFDHLPCRVVGHLVQRNKKYEFSINSGAWLTISSTDTTLMYGNFTKKTDEYFISTVWTEEIESNKKVVQKINSQPEPIKE